MGKPATEWRWWISSKINRYKLIIHKFSRCIADFGSWQVRKEKFRIPRGNSYYSSLACNRYDEISPTTNQEQICDLIWLNTRQCILPQDSLTRERIKRYKVDSQYLRGGKGARTRGPLEPSPVGAINNWRRIPCSSFTQAVINSASFSL